MGTRVSSGTDSSRRCTLLTTGTWACWQTSPRRSRLEETELKAEAETEGMFAADNEVTINEELGCVGVTAQPRHLEQLCHTLYCERMTMFSFRVDEDEAEEARQWAERLGVDRSALLRDALHRYLVRLRAEKDVEAWIRRPLDSDEKSLAAIADWGPAEDWVDWANEAG